MRPGLRLAVALAAMLAALTAIIATLAYRGLIRFNHPKLADFPVQGIDVSHHQGAIDWPALKGPRLRFAWLKASEGENHRDREFVRNWSAARAAGIVPGAYHYYSLCKPPREQAANFLAALAAVRGRGLPPAVDAEFGGNCAQRPAPEAFSAALSVFLRQIEQAAGCKPVVYLTPDFHHAYRGAIPAHPLWVRSLFTTPTLRRWRDWRWWQYTNRAQLPGIAGYVDLDVYRGSQREFEAELCAYRVRAMG